MRNVLLAATPSLSAFHLAVMLEISDQIIKPNPPYQGAFMPPLASLGLSLAHNGHCFTFVLVPRTLSDWLTIVVNFHPPRSEYQHF
jgi:hypothetical protein